MQKRILILTTGNGGGHRSSSDAIKSALLELLPNADVNAYDAMEFMPGYSSNEQGYISLTSRYRLLWKVFFEITSFFKGISNLVLSKPIYKRFRRFVLDYKPDVILSVHPCFVGSVNICLKKMKLSIPFCTCIIDLVKHSYLWHDKKCEITFVPTSQMYDLLLKKGFEKEKLVHSGFPINESFNKINKNPRTEISVPNVLMVSPSLKSDKVTLDLILTTLKHNVNLTVVTGSNEKLKEYLDKKLIGTNNVTVLGYVRDMDKRLSDADVLIAKAGPNMILEAVKMCVPILITGHILGQEERNYQYIVENGYGFKCDSPKELSDALTRLFANDYELLKKTSRNEQGCNDTSGAKVVAEHLLKTLNKVPNY
ncbi:MAG: glycosyltransferase [Oscillospiraceae bacterium]|jgi:processive 1,2-diacylglycerol beta-glucosyltransferase|nr:glycosyltransferase [Oscillospiraceae bacterium]